MRRALRDFGDDQSGQAFLELAFFAPVVICAIFCVIFFAQLGVLSERSESAVRYGNVSYKNGNEAYSIASVYALINEVQQPADPSQLTALCLQPDTASTGAPETKIQTDIKNALVQAQQIGTAVGPSAKPFWKPTTVSVPGCQPNTIRLNPANSTGGATGQSAAATSNGGLPLSTAGLSVSSTVTQPSALDILLNFGQPGRDRQHINTETSAHETFINVAAPNTLIACEPGFQIAASALSPSITPSQQQALSNFCPSALNSSTGS